MEKSCIWNLKPIINKQKLPKSWDEFCAYYPVPLSFSLKQDPHAPVGPTQIELIFMLSEFTKDRKIAEAILALLKLILLRDYYNDSWKPNWTDESYKFIIGFHNGYIETWSAAATARVLCFKTKELRDGFLRNFRPLIEKIKPLYGIIK